MGSGCLASIPWLILSQYTDSQWWSESSTNKGSYTLCKATFCTEWYITGLIHMHAVFTTSFLWNLRLAVETGSVQKRKDSS